MAKSEAYTTHPFPYFNLKVTRDKSAIQQALDAKYKVAEPHEGRPQSEHIWKEFLACAALIADTGKSKGQYTPNLQKVEKIIDRCRPAVEADILGYAVPANELALQQLQQIKQKADARWGLAPDAATDLIDEAIRKNGIRLLGPGEKKQGFDDPKPKPVGKLEAHPLEGAVRLSWTSPDGCDQVVIRRTGGPGGPGGNSSPIHLPITATEHRDEPVTPGVRYVYQIGTTVPGSDADAFQTVEARPRGKVAPFDTQPLGLKAALTWKNPPNTADVLLLKSGQPLARLVDADGGLLPLSKDVRTIPLGTAERHEDADVRRGETYFYRIVVRHPTDVYSVSESQSVTFVALPPPPDETGLVAEAHLNSVTLKWKPVSHAGEVLYRVVRSETPDPSDRAAGLKRWKMRHSSLEDRTVEPGVSYWYAVTTEIGGRVSDREACCGPVLARGEIAELRPQAASGAVHLTWSPPKKAKRIEIRRSQGQPPDPPKTPGEQPAGVLLRTFTAEREWHDQGLQNDIPHYYRVSCVFQQADGREVVTRGEVCDAVPTPPPLGVTGVCIARAAQGVEIRWSAAPPDGQVEVVRSASLPAVPSGTLQSRAKATSRGDVFAATGPTRAVDAHPTAAAPHYLVYHSKGGQSLFCGACHYVDVDQVSVRATGLTVAVEWKWPPRRGAVEIRCVTQADPNVVLHAAKVDGPGQTGGMGRHVFSVPEQGEYVVRVVYRSDDPPTVTVCGPGRKGGVRVGNTGQVTWRLKRSLFRRVPTLQLEPDGPLGGVRAFVLMGKESDTPASATDGVPLARLEVNGATPPLWEAPVCRPADAFGHRVGEVHCRLFAEPEDGVVIDPPPFEERII